LSNSTVIFYDALGRVTTNAVYDASSNRVEIITTAYAPDQNSATTVAGSGSISGLAAITTTTFSDTFGKTVLTQRFPTAGVTNFTINAYNILENLLTTRDELGKTNTFAYDALNRVKTQTLPDSAAINFAYNAMNSLTNRLMPGGLTWSATFDSANRVL